MITMRHPETGHTYDVADKPKSIALMESRGWVRDTEPDSDSDDTSDQGDGDAGTPPPPSWLDSDDDTSDTE